MSVAKSELRSASDLSQASLGTPHFRTFGRHFIDGYGRIVQLRGVNVSGASKLPSSPDGLASLADSQFFQHRSISFVNRPFPLAEAPLHFARLKAWGLTLIRLLVTWEALAHAGPNPDQDMDEEYLTYLHDLISLMQQDGIKVVICAHQDVWSRFSGGSGAPGWTFEKAGLDIGAFRATGAAYVDVTHNNAKQTTEEKAETDDGKDHPAVRKKQTGEKIKRKKEPIGAFVWPSGYQKLAAASMATLFWAGDIFAWKLQLPHWNARNSQQLINIREYLQESYIEYFGRLVDRVGHLESVMGVDVMNEPHRGFIGHSDWNKWKYETDLHVGQFPSMLQSMALGSGYKQAVPFYVKSWPFPTRKTHSSIIDPLGKSAWLEDAAMGQCVWRAHGAWEWDKGKKVPVVLRQDFFARDPRPNQQNRRLEWYRDFYAPFLSRFTARMRQKWPHLLLFVEPIPNEFFPPWSHGDLTSKLNEEDRQALMRASFDQSYATKTFIEVERPLGFVYAPHFYDLHVLFGKVYRDMSVNVQGLSRGMFIFQAIYFGIEGLKKNYMHQISQLKINGEVSLGSVPTIIGEVGLPWDINGGSALKTGEYHKHTELLDALIEAMEQNRVGFTLWNYNPDNKTSTGDGWNMEDFSLMCDDRSARDIDHKRPDDELYRSGRSLEAIIRPYAVKVAGFPFKTKWDREKLFFEFHYANGPTDQLAAANHQTEDESVLLNLQKRTEVYLPAYHFDGHDLRIQVKDGSYLLDREAQTLYLDHEQETPGYEHIVRISILGPPPAKRRTSAWYQLTVQDTCTIAALIFIVLLCVIIADYLVKPLLDSFEEIDRTRASQIHHTGL